jgi:ribulose-5-phosphate 4-epimerase/fuculose-1-phosphate aldolase
MLSEEARIREDICRFGRSLFERGLTSGSSGNISIRLADGGILATPTNSSLGFLDPARLSRLNDAGRLVSGDPPTKELPLHTALFETRHDARAVVHLHCTHSVAVSMLPDVDPTDAIPPMTAYYVMRVGRTAIVPYFRPGDPAITHAIRALGGKYSAVLLANHGPIVAAKDLESAIYATEELEESAKLYLLLRGMNPRILSSAQIDDLVTHFNLDRPIGEDRAAITGRSSAKEQ